MGCIIVVEKFNCYWMLVLRTKKVYDVFIQNTSRLAR